MDPTVYVVLDRTAARGRELETILDGAIEGGCRMVQLREKEWPSGRVLPLARRLRARCRERGVTFFVNDRVDLALAVEADGVHLGQDDLPAAAARPLLRAGMRLGLSTHSAAQVLRAQADGGDYIAIGSMFPTRSKPEFELVGPEVIRRVRGEIDVPIVGIGGITLDNLAAVIEAGADGIAVISAVCGAADPALATRALLDGVRRARVARPATP